MIKTMLIGIGFVGALMAGVSLNSPKQASYPVVTITTPTPTPTPVPSEQPAPYISTAPAVVPKPYIAPTVTFITPNYVAPVAPTPPPVVENPNTGWDRWK